MVNYTIIGDRHVGYDVLSIFFPPHILKRTNLGLVNFNSFTELVIDKTIEMGILLNKSK